MFEKSIPPSMNNLVKSTVAKLKIIKLDAWNVRDSFETVNLHNAVLGYSKVSSPLIIERLNLFHQNIVCQFYVESCRNETRNEKAFLSI